MSNVPLPVLPFVVSSSRSFTGDQTFGPFYPPAGYKGVKISYLTGTVPGSHSFTVAIQRLAAVNPTTQAKSYETILTSAAVSASDTAGSVETYPGASAVANVLAGRHVGFAVRVFVDHTGASAIPYDIRGEWLP